MIPGKQRCRNHGGLSTGAKTEAGRQAIIESNKRRASQKRQELLVTLAEQKERAYQEWRERMRRG